MKVIKLDAIDSTNEFLKRLVNEQFVENYTVITAENQTKGKGQMGAVWVSEKGKNLIMSVLIKNCITDANQLFNLNIIVSLSVVEALNEFKIPKLAIKWPNDIMSDAKKIGGILIENSLKSDGSIFSIVGLGLNVNQINFDLLPKASSMALVCNQQFDKEVLLDFIIEKVKQNIQLWESKSDVMWETYTNKLFKKGIPMPFQKLSGQNFMGMIQGVSATGKLRILLEDDTVAKFDIKEIQFLY